MSLRPLPPDARQNKPFSNGGAMPRENKERYRFLDPKTGQGHRRRTALAVALFLGFCAPASAAWQTGDVITFAQDAWGDPPSTAAGILIANFENVYLNQLEVGIPGT